MRFVVESQRQPGQRFERHPFPDRTLKQAMKRAKATPAHQVRVLKTNKGETLKVYREENGLKF